jgi:hypothetical protein
MPIVVSEGFPEFARFFNHSHLWKLQLSCMGFPMAIGARENAFFNFFLNLLPTPRISFPGNIEVFLRRVSAIVKDHAALTAECSAIELLRKMRPAGAIDCSHGARRNFYNRTFV